MGSTTKTTRRPEGVTETGRAEGGRGGGKARGTHSPLIDVSLREAGGSVGVEPLPPLSRWLVHGQQVSTGDITEEKNSGERMQRRSNVCCVSWGGGVDAVSSVE